MKKIINKSILPLVAGLGIMFSGCSDELLDIEPVFALSSNAVFVDEAGANAAVLGMYGGFADGNNLGYRMFVIGDIATDDVAHTGSFFSWRDLDARNWDQTNGEFTATWNAAYNTINRANNILANVDGIDMPQAVKDQFKGEALFARALNHFNLARYYGDVPIVLTPTSAPIDESYFVTRDPINQVYQQIEADLTQAIGMLPESYSSNNNTRHRATSGAAQALLARLELYRGNYAQAAAAATSVISNANYALTSYEAQVADKGTTEAIFELFFDANNQNPVTFWYGRNNGGRFEFGATAELWNAFEEGDLRRASSITEEEADVFVNNKFRDNTTGSDGVHVLRLAEMYLIRAEARVRTGDFVGASMDVQTIRRRAFGDETLEFSLPSSEEEAIDAILAERRLEFAFEGHRWHDLVRTGRATGTLNITASQNLMPVPQAAIDVNAKLTQNPGY